MTFGEKADHHCENVSQESIYRALGPEVVVNHLPPPVRNTCCSRIKDNIDLMLGRSELET